MLIKIVVSPLSFTNIFGNLLTNKVGMEAIF